MITFWSGCFAAMLLPPRLVVLVALLRLEVLRPDLDRLAFAVPVVRLEIDAPLALRAVEDGHREAFDALAAQH